MSSFLFVLVLFPCFLFFDVCCLWKRTSERRHAERAGRSRRRAGPRAGRGEREPSGAAASARRGGPGNDTAQKRGQHAARTERPDGTHSQAQGSRHDHSGDSVCVFCDLFVFVFEQQRKWKPLKSKNVSTFIILSFLFFLSFQHYHLLHATQHITIARMMRKAPTPMMIHAQ